MALLHDSVDSKKLDTRMIERNINRGVISRQDYDVSITQLADDGENAEWVSIETLDQEGDKDSNGKNSRSYG